MTLDQVISLIASLGACGAAIATLLTVIQISKQRKTTYRPEIALLRTLFEGTTAESDTVPSSWAPTNTNSAFEAEKIPNEKLSPFAIPVANIGLGAAKDVTVTWSFPITELVGEINKRAQRTLTPAYFTFENGIFSAKSESFGSWSSFWRNQQEETLDYILPASFQRAPLMLRLPHAYIVGVSSLIALAVREDKEPFPEIPNLAVRFEYRDIGNDKHEANFYVELKLSAIVGKGESIHGYLEFRKVKPN